MPPFEQLFLERAFQAAGKPRQPAKKPDPQRACSIARNKDRNPSLGHRLAPSLLTGCPLGTAVLVITQAGSDHLGWASAGLRSSGGLEPGPTVFIKPNGFRPLERLWLTSWAPPEHLSENAKIRPRGTGFVFRVAPGAGLFHRLRWWAGRESNPHSFRGGFTDRGTCVRQCSPKFAGRQRSASRAAFCSPPCAQVRPNRCQTAVKFARRAIPPDGWPENATAGGGEELAREMARRPWPSSRSWASRRTRCSTGCRSQADGQRSGAQRTRLALNPR